MAKEESLRVLEGRLGELTLSGEASSFRYERRGRQPNGS